MQATLLQWSNAKSRFESDISRKNEGRKSGNNFQSRGWVRKSWKTKNFNPENNPLLEESSTEEEDSTQEMQTAYSHKVLPTNPITNPDSAYQSPSRDPNTIQETTEDDFEENINNRVTFEY